MSLFIKQKNSSVRKRKKIRIIKYFRQNEHSVNKGGNKDSEEERGEGEFRRNIRLKTGVMDRLVT